MDFATYIYPLIWMLLLLGGWRQRLFSRYPIFYLYVVATAIGTAVTLGVVRMKGAGSIEYLNVYLAAMLVVHAFEIALAVKGYRLFAERPSSIHFGVALVLAVGLETLAPLNYFFSHIFHVLFVLGAYCATRAALAAFLSDFDPGKNWKAILLGILLSNVVLAVNHACSVAAPDRWPNKAVNAVIQVSQMAMWIIFLVGMRHYAPPIPLNPSASDQVVMSRD